MSPPDETDEELLDDAEPWADPPPLTETVTWLCELVLMFTFPGLPLPVPGDAGGGGPPGDEPPQPQTLALPGALDPRVGMPPTGLDGAGPAPPPPPTGELVCGTCGR